MQLNRSSFPIAKMHIMLINMYKYQRETNLSVTQRTQTIQRTKPGGPKTANPTFFTVTLLVT